MAWYRFRHRTSFAFPRLRQTRVVQGGGMSRSERSSWRRSEFIVTTGGGREGPPGVVCAAPPEVPDVSKYGLLAEGAFDSTRKEPAKNPLLHPMQ